MFTFNGINSENYFLVNKVKRSLLPSVSRNYIDMPGLPGAYHTKTKLGITKISVEITIHKNIVQDYMLLKREIASWLFTEEEKFLTFSREPHISYLASIEGETDLDEMFVLGTGTINFICSNPIGFSEETSIVFTNDEAPPNVEGTYKTYPRIEATFKTSASEFIITHSQQNKFVRIVRNFVVGDTLTIDFATGKTMLNGLVTMPILDWMNSDFFVLNPGSQNLVITPSNVADTTLFWKPRWL